MQAACLIAWQPGLACVGGTFRDTRIKALYTQAVGARPQPRISCTCTHACLLAYSFLKKSPGPTCSLPPCHSQRVPPGVVIRQVHRRLRGWWSGLAASAATCCAGRRKPHQLGGGGLAAVAAQLLCGRRAHRVHQGREGVHRARHAVLVLRAAHPATGHMPHVTWRLQLPRHSEGRNMACRQEQRGRPGGGGARARTMRLLMPSAAGRWAARAQAAMAALQACELGSSGAPGCQACRSRASMASDCPVCAYACTAGACDHQTLRSQS